MIRHVVTFRFRARDPEGRAAAASELRSALEPLAEVVPGVRSLEIGIDDGAVPGHWDAVLISLHDSFEALAAYQVHPAHQAALTIVGALVTDKSVVDYEAGAPR
ncbi:Dabb family protein [Leucobacter weissii]|uniref:Dabb family protein n=1 Tax=Leucobacter weissii TaxID=1983706 RepID=A0A939MIT1_9MICO|nr:Dabb family protein [Leucobacter weissii]MBO1901508.1 Dabb family protein [Leucobacter weissii]